MLLPLPLCNAATTATNGPHKPSFSQGASMHMGRSSEVRLAASRGKSPCDQAASQPTQLLLTGSASLLCSVPGDIGTAPSLVYTTTGGRLRYEGSSLHVAGKETPKYSSIITAAGKSTTQHTRPVSTIHSIVRDSCNQPLLAAVQHARLQLGCCCWPRMAGSQLLKLHTLFRGSKRLPTVIFSTGRASAAGQPSPKACTTACRIMCTGSQGSWV